MKLKVTKETFNNYIFSQWAVARGLAKMAGSIQNGPTGGKIAELFESMEYGPAPESDKIAKVYLCVLPVS